jgi:hypothetical protein
MHRERPCVICRTPTRALVNLSERPGRSFLCSLLCRRIYLESRSPEPLYPAPPPPTPPEVARVMRRGRKAARRLEAD